MDVRTIDPTRITIADLEILEAKTLASAQPRPLVTKRDARQQLIGAMRMINHFSGGDMRDEINTVEFLTQQNDALEAENARLRAELEAEKSHYQNQHTAEISGFKKALRNIAAVLDLYSDPFDVKPFSKWKNDEKGKWMLAASESIKWAVQRADNQLDPVNAVAIAADPETPPLPPPHAQGGEL